MHFEEAIDLVRFECVSQQGRLVGFVKDGSWRTANCHRTRPRWVNELPTTRPCARTPPLDDPSLAGTRRPRTGGSGLADDSGQPRAATLISSCLRSSGARWTDGITMDRGVGTSPVSYRTKVRPAPQQSPSAPRLGRGAGFGGAIFIAESAGDGFRGGVLASGRESRARAGKPRMGIVAGLLQRSTRGGGITAQSAASVKRVAVKPAVRVFQANLSYPEPCLHLLLGRG